MKILSFAATIAAVSLSTAAVAQTLPSGDVELIVPFEPGGSVDVTSRLLAEAANSLQDEATFTVVNRAGGGGVVGQAFVARAEPDGHTVLAITSSVVTNPRMKNVPYAIEDFVPVALYNLDPEVIAVPANSEFETAEDFLAAAADRQMNVVVAGLATSHHMSGLAIEKATGLTMNYIPTSGFGAQVQAIAGGHADAALWPLGEASTQLDGGAIRVLAIAQEERHPELPDVPTFQEAGIDLPLWATFRGWAVPAGTPEETVTALSGLMAEVSQSPAYVEKMTAAGYEPVFRDAAGFEAVVQDYDTQTSAIIEEFGLTE